MRTAVIRVNLDPAGDLPAQRLDAAVGALREQGIEVIAPDFARVPRHAREIELLIAGDDVPALRSWARERCADALGAQGPAVPGPVAGAATFLSRGTDDDALGVVRAFGISAELHRHWERDEEIAVFTITRADAARVPESRLHTALEAALNCDVRIVIADRPNNPNAELEAAELMPAWTAGGYPGIEPRLIIHGPGRENQGDYQRRGGYQPGREGAELIAAVTAAGLRGRGGAAFPLGRKLTTVAAQPTGNGAPVVVVNGEEGEPASVKDRWLLRTRPHLVIDGALRAARAVRADRAYIYLSDPVAARSVRSALGELGDLPVEVSVWQVEPGYVAGEETAVVNAVNGKPAKPSEKPPRPFEEGVRGLPTLVSNVETIANLPGVATAAEPRADTFLLTLGGAVNRPGLYEVPFGATIGEVTEFLGGGAAGITRGYLMGGYFAGLVNSRGAGLPLDYDALRAERSGLGCGAITVLGPDDCPVGVSAQLLAYFARENAGQCGSCFNGTAAMAAVAAGLATGAAADADLERLRHWCVSLPGRGACGTLDGAVNIARSLLDEFAGEVAAHEHGRCQRCAATDFTAKTAPFAVDPGELAPEEAPV